MHYGSPHVHVSKAKWRGRQLMHIPCWWEPTNSIKHHPEMADYSGPIMTDVFHVHEFWDNKTPERQSNTAQFSMQYNKFGRKNICFRWDVNSTTFFVLEKDFHYWDSSEVQVTSMYTHKYIYGIVHIQMYNVCTYIPTVCLVQTLHICVNVCSSCSFSLLCLFFC